MSDFMSYEEKLCCGDDVETTKRQKHGFHLPPAQDEMTDRTSAEGDRGAVTGFTGLLI